MGFVYLFKRKCVIMINNKRKTALIILISILLIIAIILSVIIWKNLNAGELKSDDYKISSGEINITVSNPNHDQSVELVENPINFNKLEEQNEDIYAWITVPNTKIDYPVLQSYAEDDLFYVDHNINKKKAAAGALFTQKLNQKDFSDPNTIIYGHNMKNGTMFRHLHKFKKEKFFNENEFFYIYTRGHIYTYRIFAAYEYDDRHILNSFNFHDKDVYAEYLEYAQNPNSIYKNTREVNITTDDKIVTLSTCLATNKPNNRYLVQGVLIKDELTY